MSERPIYFPQPSADEMVRAILDGRKTQMRRPVKPQPHRCLQPRLRDAPWHPGDRLWVQECWRPVGPWETRSETVQYRADGEYARKIGWPEAFRIKTTDGREKWRSSIHMSRWASRIRRPVKRVWVERVQDISEEDARAEGFERREHFIRAWDSIYAAKGCGFDANLWNWACEFERGSR